MSGICGVIYLSESRTPAPDGISRMCAALSKTDSARASRSSVTASGPRFSMAVTDSQVRDMGIASRQIEGAAVALAYIGDIDPREDTLSADSDGNRIAALLLDRYLHAGVRFVRLIRSDIAIALWDGRDCILHLVTDPFRIQPLLYAQDPGRVVFASRAAGILACTPPIRKTVRPEGIVDIVGSSKIPSPRTIFHEMHKVPPAHIVSFRNASVTSEPYWDLDFRARRTAREPELARQVRAAFEDAMRHRLQTAGPITEVGAFLSGGIDSTVVTGVLSQLSGTSIKTFSIGFSERSFNEIDYARISSRAFQTDHHEYFVTADDARELIPVIVDAFDEPFGNASAVPTYYCAKLAREHGVRTLFAGDGGDELFAGNERYASQRLFEVYHQVPRPIREYLLSPIVFGLARWTRVPLFVKGMKYIERARPPYEQRLGSYGFFRTVMLQEFFRDDFLSELPADYSPSLSARDLFASAPADDPLGRHLYLDLKQTISDNDLLKVTRMTAAAGVHVRFPFLDRRLAELAAGVPADIRMRGLELRSFFKRAYRSLLPPETIAKRKHGFGLPVPVWLRTDPQLIALTRDLLLSPTSRISTWIRPQALERLLESLMADRTSFYGTAVWNLIILECWLRAFAGTPSIDVAD